MQPAGHHRSALSSPIIKYGVTEIILMKKNLTRNPGGFILLEQFRQAKNTLLPGAENDGGGDAGVYMFF